MDFTKLSKEELQTKKLEGAEASIELDKREDYKDFKWCFENLFETMKKEDTIDKRTLSIVFTEGEETHRFWIRRETITKIPF